MHGENCARTFSDESTGVKLKKRFYKKAGFKPSPKADLISKQGQ